MTQGTNRRTTARASALALALLLLATSASLPAEAESGSLHVAIQTAGGRTTFAAGEAIQFAESIHAAACAPTGRSWAFGDGATSTQAAPVHAYASPGNVHVTLTVTSACDKPRTAQLELKIRERGPVAVLAVAPDPVAAGEIILLDASGSRAPAGSVYRFTVDGVLVAEHDAPQASWTLTSAGPHVATVTVTAPGGDPKHEDPPGNHYGHLGGGQSSASAAFAVAAGPVASVAVSPSSATVGPGGGVAFSASAFDAYGNPVAASPAWTSTCGEATADGVVTAPTSVGACSVVARVGGVAGTGTLVVVPGPLAQLVVEPPAIELLAGGTTLFTAEGADAHGNPVPVAPEWLASCGSVDETGAYVAPEDGASCVVTASADGVAAEASVVVTTPQSPLARIALTGPATLVAGTTGAYEATGFDADGAEVPLETTEVLFAAPTRAGEAQVCHAEQGVTGCLAVLVVPDALARIDVVPAEASVVAGTTLGFAALGYDQHGNAVETTPTFAAARGAFDGATYHAPTLAGADVVTATEGDVAGVAAVTVLPAALHTLVVSGPTVVTVGSTVDYDALGYDAYGNPVATAPAWTADVGDVDADGVLIAATLVGSGTVAAAQGDVSGSLPVQLVPGPVARIDVTPAEATTNLGQPLVLGAAAFDAYGNAVEDAASAWSTTLGGITQTGLFLAEEPGEAVVTAASGGVEGVARVLVQDVLLVVVTIEHDEYTPVDAVLGGITGTVEVFHADGTPLQGAVVLVTMDHRLVGLGMARLPVDAVIQGETDADGRLGFRATLQGMLPGQHQVVARATWGANAGAGSDGYRVGPL